MQRKAEPYEYTVYWSEKIDGPLIVLDHVKDIGFEEVAELRLSDGTERLGRVVQIYGDKAVLQVLKVQKDFHLQIRKQDLQAGLWSLHYLRKCLEERSADQEGL